MRKIVIVLLVAGALVLAANIQADDQTAADIECVTFINCPRGISTSHCTPVSFQFEAVNVHSEKPNRGFRYRLVSGPGTIDERTGLWTFDPTTVNIKEWGQRFKVTVVVTQGYGKQADTCRFSVRVYNYAPRPFLPGPYHKDSIPVTVGVDNVIPIWWLDRDSCDTVQKQVTAFSPQPSGALYLNDEGNLIFHPVISDTGMSFIVRLTADDGISSNSLDLRLFVETPVVTPGEYALRIEREYMVMQGQFQDLSVTLEQASTDSATGGLGGFDLLMCYDASALSLQLVKTDSSPFYNQCDWEYFTYRFGAIVDTHPGIPSGFVRVVGLAETNNGPIHPTCTPKYIPAIPATLFTMRFLVSNDRTLECQFIPISFLWEDCGDNALANWDGSQLYIAGRVFDYFNQDVQIDPALASFPGLAGVPSDSCVFVSPNKPKPERNIDFYHGGMDIRCADTIDPRGDINLNGLAFELSDCVMFSNYFIHGLAAFQGHAQGSTEASDINGDGIPLTLADYVSLERIVVGEPLPNPVPSPNPVIITVSPGETNGCILSTSDTLGALYLVVEGPVLPELLVHDLDMKYSVESNTTRILLSGGCSSVSKIAPGSVVFIHDDSAQTCQIVGIEASSYYGVIMPVVLDGPTSVEDSDNFSLPRTFALRQNYPNPFNAGTMISFDLPKASDVRLEVLNVAGQLVYEVNRHYAAGSHQIGWDGTTGGRNVASGVYYYRIQTGEFTATRKMVLLK